MAKLIHEVIVEAGKKRSKAEKIECLKNLVCQKFKKKKHLGDRYLNEFFSIHPPFCKSEESNARFLIQSFIL